MQEVPHNGEALRMYFQASLTPKDLFIEAENEAEFREKIKKIPVESFVFRFDRVSKEKLEKELEERHVFLKL